jgi:hypothetical protein
MEFAGAKAQIIIGRLRGAKAPFFHEKKRAARREL